MCPSEFDEHKPTKLLVVIVRRKGSLVVSLFCSNIHLNDLSTHLGYSPVAPLLKDRIKYQQWQVRIRISIVLWRIR